MSVTRSKSVAELAASNERAFRLQDDIESLHNMAKALDGGIWSFSPWLLWNMASEARDLAARIVVECKERVDEEGPHVAQHER